MSDKIIGNVTPASGPCTDPVVRELQAIHATLQRLGGQVAATMTGVRWLVRGKVGEGIYMPEEVAELAPLLGDRWDETEGVTP